MRPGELATAWRTERSLYELRLPANGWWAQVEHPDPMAALEGAPADRFARSGLAALDVAALRGPDRRITVAIATWVHAQTPDTGCPALATVPDRFAVRIR